MSETKPDNAGVKLLPPVMLLACAVLCVAAQIWLPVPRLAVPQPYFMWLGIAVLAAGLVFGFSGVRKFIVEKVNPVPTQPVSALITGGIYRVSRNPMYVGMVSLFAGLALMLGNWIFLAGAAVMFLYFDLYVIRLEEAYMTRAFGQAYQAYCARVRRWF